MIENFRYNDIVLYCKGWYQEKDGLIGDLGYLFSKVYAWTPTTEEEVARMMLRVIDVLFEQMELKYDSESFFRSYYGMFNEVKRNMRLYDISFDMACIVWVKDILSNLDSKQIKLNTPHYGKKEHFRLGCWFGKYPMSMTYKEMNRIAQKAFGY